MIRSVGRRIGMVSGVNLVRLSKLSSEQWRIKPKPLGINYSSDRGDLQKWGSFIISTPHGDGDLHTEKIAQKLLKERVWDKSSQAVYDRYQKMADDITGNQRAEFFVSLHGHDLLTRRPGSLKSRDVIEAIAIGLSDTQIYQIKDYYNQIKDLYFKNAPSLYFGNLVEDQIYNYRGQKHSFVYSALGARTYGTLRLDKVKKGLHLETPNSMRLSAKSREKSVRLLADLSLFVNFLNSFEQLANFRIYKGVLYFVKDVIIDLSKSHIFFKDDRFTVAEKFSQYPVNYISFNAAQRFCLAKNGQLPSESQWEYAASYDEVNKKKYEYGVLSNQLLKAQANFENSYEHIALRPVGSSRGTSFGGGKDFSGNVWEWTLDNFNSQTYAKRTSPVIDPQGPKIGTMKRPLEGGAIVTSSL
jgi:hypothetical protein